MDQINAVRDCAGNFDWWYFIRQSFQKQKNTEQITGTLENIEVYDPPRGLTQIYVTIDSKRFVLVWVNSPQKYQTMLSNIKIGQEVSVLVVKNNIFHLQPEPEIVDLRSNSEIYYSVDNHNSNAFIARLLVLVVFIPIGIFGLFIGYVLFARKDIQHAMRKQKRKDHK